MFLYSIPNEHYGELLTPILENSLQMHKNIEFRGKNMFAIYILITFLSNQLENTKVSANYIILYT